MQNVVKLFPTENPMALIDRAELTETVDLLAKLCTNQPGTSHIRFVSEPGGIALTSTNTVIMAESSIAADVDARFSAAIPAATLLKLLKKGGASETVVLELHHDPEEPEAERFIPVKCTVQIGGMTFTVNATSTDDFPEPIRRDPEEAFSGFQIAAAVLWNAIDGTVGAVSTDETRYYLNGIYVHAHEGHLRFIATDGHKLFMQDTDVSAGDDTATGIIPTDAAKFIAALLDGHASADPVAFEISASTVVAVYRDFAITSRLVDGTFPDYQRVVPTSSDKVAIVASAALDAAVASLSDCTGSRSVTLDFSGDELVLNASGTAGAGSAAVPCTYEGEAIQISFDVRNLRAIIDGSSPDGRKMTVRMNDASSPSLVTGTVGGWTGVIMPMRV